LSTNIKKSGCGETVLKCVSMCDTKHFIKCGLKRDRCSNFGFNQKYFVSTNFKLHTNKIIMKVLIQTNIIVFTYLQFLKKNIII